MQKILKNLRLIFSIATVGIILLLCWQCLDIYLTGNRPENFSAGVYLTPVYSVQIVSERLLNVSPFLALYAILAVITIIAQIFWGKPQRSTGKIRPCPPRAQTEKGACIARLSILGLGLLFVILGMMNGGARDVLVKAINICTECIGLG